SITPIPISARFGDNVTRRSDRIRWYDGPTLLDYLESVDVAHVHEAKPFRFPVQWVNRPNQDFRGFSVTVASGVVRRRDTVVVAASGQRSAVARIVTADGDLEEARAGSDADAGRPYRRRSGRRAGDPRQPPAGRRPVRRAP